MDKIYYFLYSVLLVNVSCSSQSAEDLWSKSKKEMDIDVKLELMDKALELEPGKAEWYFDRGTLHEIEVWSVKDMVQKGMRPDDGLAEEHYHKAIADFGKAIELKPSYAQAFYQRGLAHFEMGDDIEEACKDWHAALNLGYDSQDMITKNCP